LPYPALLSGSPRPGRAGSGSGSGRGLPPALALALALLFLLSTFAFNTVSAAGGPNTREQAAAHYRASIEAYRAGDFAGFRRETQAALAAAPGHPRYLYNLACAQALTGEPAAAVATLERLAAQRRQSEHGQAFVELQDTIERSRPAPPDMPLTPAQLARLAHPGREKPGQFGEAFAEFAAEDKEWRAKIVEVLQAMAGDIRQSRLELDQLLGFLERSRL
jgi:hypothetical protein